MLRLWSSAAFVAFVVVLGIAVGQVQAGTVTITGTDSFLLGGSTTLTATLTPSPTAPTSITITSYNRVVAYASHNTLDFPAGSNTLTFSVLSPPNGRLGGATFLFTPADLLAYDETAFNVTVQGTISASVDNSCKGFNTVTTITVTISPAAPKDIFILAGSSTSGSTSAYFNIGQAVATTTFTELQPGTVTVTFSHPLYQSTGVTYTVLRTFSSTAPAVVTNGNITFTASATLAPATPTELTVTSNIGAQLPSQTFTFASAGVVVSVNADRVYPAGTFVTTLTAAGYCPLTITTVSLPPTCTPGTQVTYFGTCGNCPGFLTEAGACGNVGVCLQSTCQVGQLRCSCPSGFKGRACEFGPSALTFGVSATTSTVAVGVVTFQPTSSFAVPIVQGVFAPLTNGISALYGSNPAVGAPQFSTPFYGFQVGFLCNDNTEFSASGTPVSISLLLNRGVISDRDANDLKLYYFDVPSKTYISETRCTGNTTLSSFVDNAGRQVISFQICFSGVYQFFSIDPGNRPALAPSVKARPIEVTSGQTGLQPQFPPDPSFNVDQFLGEPLHLAIGSVDSAFTIQPAISLIVVMVVLVMAFIA